MADRDSEVYARYEMALAALTVIPGQLTKALDGAKRNLEKTLIDTDAEFSAEAERLAKLRRTISSRYDIIAKTLKEGGVIVPLQLRPESNQAGDAASLVSVIKAQSKAEVSVEAELRAVRTSLRREEAANAERRVAGQQAAGALKRRQEQVRRAREETGAEEQRVHHAAETRARRRKILVIVGIAAITTVAMIVIIVLLNQWPTMQGA